MSNRKLSDTDRRLTGLAGIHKLRALLFAEGIQYKHIAIGAGVFASDVSLWLQDRKEVPRAADYVAERLGISRGEVEQLRKDQAPQPAEVA
ncbi:MAG TPA: hypothetical protein VGV85_00010 [Longimicrobiaceae bacterium]|nr:hypothetical protein [Longimicrobiaceae bacterium]